MISSTLSRWSLFSPQETKPTHQTIQQQTHLQTDDLENSGYVLVEETPTLQSTNERTQSACKHVLLPKEPCVVAKETAQAISDVIQPQYGLEDFYTPPDLGIITLENKKIFINFTQNTFTEVFLYNTDVIQQLESRKWQLRPVQHLNREKLNFKTSTAFMQDLDTASVCTSTTSSTAALQSRGNCPKEKNDSEESAARTLAERPITQVRAHNATGSLTRCLIVSTFLVSLWNIYQSTNR